jgi:hypothetical protein
MFTAAEVTFAKLGNKTAGYSAGALMFATGDLLLANSSSLDGSLLQYSLYGMSLAWGVGALKYPLEKIAEMNDSKLLYSIADITQSICGTVNLGLRVPGVVTSVIDGEYILTTAIYLWGVADVFFKEITRKIKTF